MAKLTNISTGIGDMTIPNQFGNNIRIGRADGNPEIAIKVEDASGHHLVIGITQNGTYQLMQNGTRIGATINGEAIPIRTQDEGETRELTNGDVIRIINEQVAASGDNARRLFECTFVDEPEVDELATDSIGSVFMASDSMISSRSIVDLHGRNAAQVLDGVFNVNAALLKESNNRFQTAAETLRRVFPGKNIDRVSIAMLEGNDLSEIGFSSRTESDRAHYSRTAADQAMSEQEVVLDEGITATTESIISTGAASVMYAPIMADNGEVKVPIGVIVVDSAKQAEFDENDAAVLAGVSTSVSLAVQHDKLTREAVANAVLLHDLEAGKVVQEEFIPKEAPTIPGFDIAQIYEAASKIGGDYFEYFEFKDDQGPGHAIVMADIMDHGPAAAMNMSRLQAQVQIIMDKMTTDTSFDPEAFLRELNEIAPLNTPFILLIVRPNSDEITVLNQGHLLPFVTNNETGETAEIDNNEDFGLPLGIVGGSDAVISIPVTIKLEPGSRMLVTTDGITEARTRREQIVYGKDPLLNSLRTQAESAESALENVMSSVNTHLKEEGNADDISAICIRRI